MKDRLAKILGNTAEKINIHTFHSLCFGILKENYKKAGLCANFRIITKNEREFLDKEKTEEMPDFEELYQKMKDQVQFIMIDGVGCMGETEETGKAYVEEQGFTFPVYYDRKMEAVINYGIQAFPTTYILNSEGRLVTGGRGMLSKDNLQGLLDQVMK